MHLRSFKKRKVKSLPKCEHEHSPEAIKERLSQETKPSYLRDWVYGGIDGVVTTFAVVSGVQGAELAASSAIILGFANLIADGFSMAASNYLGTQTELQLQSRYEAIEEKHIILYPEGEKEEVRQILEQKGLTGTTLFDAVTAITSNRKQWIRTMLSEEYGLPLSTRNPWKAALSTLLSFLLCGLIPLVPYLLGIKFRFLLSSIATGIVFFLIGSIRSNWTSARWWQSGLITFIIGSSAASLAYIVGAILRNLTFFAY
jgi:VIT1/CCC1 family predicted Fe2+/Mn2+ transporter